MAAFGSIARDLQIYEEILYDMQKIARMMNLQSNSMLFVMLISLVVFIYFQYQFSIFIRGDDSQLVHIILLRDIRHPLVRRRNISIVVGSHQRHVC